MKFVKGKFIWIFVLALSPFSILNPGIGFAQTGQARSQGANIQQPNNSRGSFGGGRNPAGGRNDRNGNVGFLRMLDQNRPQHGGRELFSIRDQNHHEMDRHRGTDSLTFGAYSGTPYSGYYPYGYYDQGYGSQFGYDGADNISSHDLGYADGINAGQTDKIQGNLYNPRQYDRSTDSDYFQGFVDGYEDGYRR